MESAGSADALGARFAAGLVMDEAAGLLADEAPLVMAGMVAPPADAAIGRSRSGRLAIDRRGDALIAAARAWLAARTTGERSVDERRVGEETR